MANSRTKSAKVQASQADYKEVPYRIQEFYAKHPDGRLVSELVRYDIDRYETDNRGRTMAVGVVIVKGLAYRSPDDPLPGVGYSQLLMPGATPYTKGSEIENAETSAWGRAIAAIGIATKEGIASAQEIAAKAGYNDDDGDAAGNVTRTRKASKAADDDKRADLVKLLRSRIDEAEELGSDVVNRHSIRNHVKKTPEAGEYETLSELFSKGTRDELIIVGRYVAGKIEEARAA